MFSSSPGWLHYCDPNAKHCFRGNFQKREKVNPEEVMLVPLWKDHPTGWKACSAVRNIFSRTLVQPSSALVYSQSDDPVCACRFVGECGAWMRAGLRDGTASRFRQGRPGLALHAPVWVISFSSDAFWFSAVLGFFLKINKESFEGTDCIFGKRHF